MILVSSSESIPSTKMAGEEADTMLNSGTSIHPLYLLQVIISQKIKPKFTGAIFEV